MNSNIKDNIPSLPGVEEDKPDNFSGTAQADAYHDYVEEPDDPDILFNSKASQLEQSFPMKLHYMLADIAKDGLEHIVGWQVHGRCFVVRDQPLFVKRALPL
jgi:hypothetical protein